MIIFDIIDDYLSYRKIQMSKITINVTTGVPQGMIFGPTLWNLLYDDNSDYR